MKETIKTWLKSALATLESAEEIPSGLPVVIQLDRTRDPQFGDFSTNVAMLLAKPARMKPRDLAAKIIAYLPEESHALLSEVEVAGPGFINFHIHARAQRQVLSDILSQKEAYGISTLGYGRSVYLEYVSANPTGPLHIGHGRGAAYGSALASILNATGFRVHQEYYVNDAGRQMDILATSVYLRYLECCGETFTFPRNAYRGDYIIDIAKTIHAEKGESIRSEAAMLFDGISPDEDDEGNGDKEAHIDDLIARSKVVLGDAVYRSVFDTAKDTILADIRADLGAFGVHFDCWFSERSLMETGALSQMLKRMDAAGHLYEKDGATWFRATTFGDDQDRVVIRENGQSTYFASDLAYHFWKYERGFDRFIDIFGADHHGYIKRLHAGVEAFGEDPKQLEILLIQFATLYRGSEKVSMSTRSGEFVTLRDLREEVGTDATRFFYVMRKCEQHMDFDIELAKSKTKDNPVYYIQYAHARICQVMAKAESEYGSWEAENGLTHIDLLNRPKEEDLLTALGRYPEVLEAAAINYAPHVLANYLRDLANAFHICYHDSDADGESYRFIVDERDLREARLCLAMACKYVIANGLQLLGLSQPEKM